MNNDQLFVLLLISGIVNFLFWKARNRRKERLDALETDEYYEEVLDDNYEEEPDDYYTNPCYSHNHFDKQAYENTKKSSEENFISGMQKAKNDDEILVKLKVRLMELLELRQDYETTHATDKEEFYRESSVMSHSIETLEEYFDEMNLIDYCALLLDIFDKDREYNYGLREDKIYKTRYIYGSVQAIVEDEIKEVEKYHEGLLDKVYTRKEQLENDFTKQYAQDKRKAK